MSAAPTSTAPPGTAPPGTAPPGTASPGTAPGPDLGASAPGTPEQRRRWAVRDAAAEVAAAGGRLTLAARWFDTGCVAVAVGGTCSGPDRDAVATYFRRLERSARTELVVDLAGVRSVDRRLARVLARARIRFLIAGARVEWHHLPPGLEEELLAGAPSPAATTRP